MIRRFFIYLLQLPIRMYRALLSPYFGWQCRFLPTCSAYALEALDVHGPMKGSYLALRRLCRCHPVKFLGAGEGLDPVPPLPLHCAPRIKD